MNNHKMSYNSQNEKLTIREYGRNIQNLIHYASNLEDDDKRQIFVERVIDLMAQITPQNRNVIEYRERLWKHLFKIADFEINVKPPFEEKPTPEQTSLTPDILEYPVSERRFRHYGHNIQVMIQKAIAMEDEEKKTEYVKVISAYMKLAYKTWNREHYVSDEMIKQDLKSLSDGKLELSEDIIIENLTSSIPVRKRKNRSNHNPSRSKNTRNRRRR